MKRLLLIRFVLPLLLIGSSHLAAQERIGCPLWGFTFRVPSGWLYERTEEGVILGHETVGGLIIVVPHRSGSLGQVRSEMAAGIVQEGIVLHLVGTLASSGLNRISGDFRGIFQFQEVRAICIGTLSPYGGGAYVIALTTPEQDQGRVEGPADEIARSMHYGEVKL